MRVAVGELSVGETEVVASRSGATSFARPKSRTFTKPAVVTITLPGFTSRWTIPASWAAARPRAISSAKRSASFTSRRPRSIRSRRVSPSTSSMAIQVPRTGSSPRSWTVTMFGWLRAETAFASCRKRRVRSGSSTASGRSSLIATVRPRRVSRALKTTPMPPSPSGAAIS
jgi:hypothetical protein